MMTSKMKKFLLIAFGVLSILIYLNVKFRDIPTQYENMVVIDKNYRVSHGESARGYIWYQSKDGKVHEQEVTMGIYETQKIGSVVRVDSGKTEREAVDDVFLFFYCIFFIVCIIKICDIADNS